MASSLIPIPDQFYVSIQISAFWWTLLLACLGYTLRVYWSLLNAEIGREDAMQTVTTVRNQFLPWLTGIAAIIFGLLALLLPGLTLGLFILLFAAFALIDGIITLLRATRERSINKRWWLVFIEGLLGIALGIVILFWAQTTQMFLIILFAIWAILTGVLDVFGAFRHRAAGQSLLLSVIPGIISVIFGVLILFQVNDNLTFLVRLIGVYAIAYGVFMIIRTMGSGTPSSIDDQRRRAMPRG